MKTLRAITLFSGLALFAGHASGALIVVTPNNPQGWAQANRQNTGSASIDAAFPQSGNGSIDFQTNGTTDKADFEIQQNFGTLNTVIAAPLSFDYFRASSSTTLNFLAPVFRILFFDPITGKGGNLVWDNHFANNSAAVATDAWVHEDLASVLFYLKPFGSPAAADLHTLADWATDSRVGGNQPIFGFNSGVGQNWPGVFNGASDNLTFEGNTFNFESSTPEPATWTLFGSALLTLALARSRRQSCCRSVD